MPSGLRSRNTKERRNMRIYLRQRDGANCWICGKPMSFGPDTRNAMYATFDHVKERSAGGSDTRENLRLAHYSCNSSRGGEYSEMRRVALALLVAS
jgi:5-methylcytosine-specific restriction endonuclease McrA